MYDAAAHDLRKRVTLLAITTQTYLADVSDRVL